MLRGSWAAAAEQWQAWWGVALWLASARHTLCWELLRRDSSRHPFPSPAVLPALPATAWPAGSLHAPERRCWLFFPWLDPWHCCSQFCGTP